MVAIVAICLVGYALGLLWLYKYQHRQDGDLPAQAGAPPLTVLTAFRNEELHLPALQRDLALQTYPALTWLAVDDGSTDGSADLLQQGGDDNLSLQKIRMPGGAGKRQAIAAGVAACQTDYILQTDADCRVGETWAAQAQAYALAKEADLLIMPLRFAGGAPWALALVNVEFASVMAVTCGMARAGCPVMCNGANLLYTKRLWQAAEAHLHSRPGQGGDDMYLLDFALAHGYRVAYADAPGLWVDTAAPTSLGSFLRQRRRWAGKGVSYRSPYPLATAAVSLAGQVAFGACLWGGLTGLLPWAPGLMAAKVAAEALVIGRQMQKAGLRFPLWAFLAWQVLYLPYLIAVLLPTFAGRKTVWKT